MQEQTKKCPKCKLTLSRDLFSKDKTTKRGLYSYCKKCTREYAKEYRLENKEKAKEYTLKNKEKAKEYAKEYTSKNKEKIKAYQLKNKEKIKAYSKEYTFKNKERIKEYYSKNKEKIKAYQLKNKEKIKAYAKEYSKEYHLINRLKLNTKLSKRRKTDVNFRLSENLRSRLYQAIKNNFKAGSAVRDLGCTIPELIQYLESQFDNEMNWDNHGKWHIDHIKPLSSFDLTNRDQFLEACHYTNLQPMWAEENMKKGAKYTNKPLTHTI